MNTKDVGINNEVLLTKAKILAYIDANKLRNMTIVIQVTPKTQPRVAKACKELTNEFNKRNLNVQLAIEEEEEDEDDEGDTIPDSFAGHLISIAFSLACDQLSELNGVPAHELTVSFTKQAFHLFYSMSNEELQAFLEKKFPIPTKAG